VGAPLAGEGVGLAGYPANDAIHEAAPRAAVEGSGIAPHRRLSQDTCAHRLDQMGDGKCLPLDVAHRASAWDCQLEGKVDAAACAESDGVAPGM
jgi:hypothetical protein